jgi:glycosyltransferase involved in cell wall biosynthesis
MNKISVITSVYNSSNFLDKFLNYVNDQLEDFFEIIFIDANSTDESISKIKNFNFRDGISIKIIECSTRISVYEAWNIGIKNSSGNYIVNWNTDDILYPSALSIYSKYINKFSEIDLFYGSHVQIKSQNVDDLTGVRVWPEYSHELLLQFCFCGPFPLVKKSAIEECNYFNEKYKSSSDYDMWLKLSKNNYKFKKIPEFIGSYFYREESVSVLNMQLAQEEDKEIQNNYK